MKTKIITGATIIVLAIFLTACVMAKMPGVGDSTQRVKETSTLGLLYIEESVMDPGYSTMYTSHYPERVPTWTPPDPEYPEDYPLPITPVPYP